MRPPGKTPLWLLTLSALIAVTSVLAAEAPTQIARDMYSDGIWLADGDNCVLNGTNATLYMAENVAPSSEWAGVENTYWNTTHPANGTYALAFDAGKGQISETSTLDLNCENRTLCMWMAGDTTTDWGGFAVSCGGNQPALSIDDSFGGEYRCRDELNSDEACTLCDEPTTGVFDLVCIVFKGANGYNYMVNGVECANYSADLSGDVAAAVNWDVKDKVIYIDDYVACGRQDGLPCEYLGGAGPPPPVDYGATVATIGVQYEELEEFRASVNFSYSSTNTSAVPDGLCNSTINGTSHVLTYNSTTFLFEDDAYINYPDIANVTIESNCTGPQTQTNGSNTTTVTIYNIAPVFSFSYIIDSHNSTALINNSVYEFYYGWYEFNISITETDSFNITYTIANSTETMQQNSSNTIHSDYFRDFAHPFNLTVAVMDDDFNTTVQEISFNFTDTSNPVVYGIDNYTWANDTSFHWDVNIIDESVFSVYLSCDNGFTDNRTGLNSENYSYANFTLIQNNVTCAWHICDGHTKNGLRKTWITRSTKTGGEFIVNNLVSRIKSDDEDFELEFEAEENRYKFRMDFHEEGWNMLYYYPTAESYFFSSAKYPAWIVSTDEIWFDMDCDNVADTYTVDRGEYWEVYLLTTDKHVTCRSVGELNCIDITQRIDGTEDEVHDDTYLEVNTCPSTTAGIMALIFAFTMLMSITIVNFLFIRIPLITIFAGVGFIVFGLVYTGCGASGLFMVPIFFGIVLIFTGGMTGLS